MSQDEKTVIIQALRPSEKGAQKLIEQGRVTFDGNGQAELPWEIAAQLVEASKFYVLADGSEWPEDADVVPAKPLSESEKLRLNSPLNRGNAPDSARKVKKIGSLEIVEKDTSFKRAKPRGNENIVGPDPNGGVAPRLEKNPTSEGLRQQFNELEESSLRSILEEAGNVIDPEATKADLVDIAVKSAKEAG